MYVYIFEKGVIVPKLIPTSFSNGVQFRLEFCQPLQNNVLV